MLTQTKKKIDPFNNITYGSTSLEEFVHFSYDNHKQYPIRIESVGITHPDPKYFIERKRSDYFIFEYIKSGKGYLEISGKEYTLTADCIYIIKPGAAKHRYGADKKDPYEKIWINFFSDFFTDILNAFGLLEEVVFENTNCGELFEQLITLGKEHSDNDEIYLTASEILFKIVLNLVKSHQQKLLSPTANIIKECLDRSLYRKITIEDLAQEINISKSQMCREFKKYFSTTPYQYLIDKRINIAKNLLTRTTLSIKEISNTLCFVDEYYFSNAFKKKIGISPRAYRKK